MKTHFRECVGDMALARMFGDESVYIPEDFGAYVTADNVAEHVAQMAQAEPLPLEEYTAQVPVLMYHHISEDVATDMVISPARFEAHMAALKEHGWNSVTIRQLIEFGEQGTPLPDHPVLITFDDGYTSNLELAAPILERHGLNAVIFVIGINAGQSVYAHSGQPLDPPPSSA